jgi:hypothetical protein
MAVILRIDVDSPYGKKNFINHVFSRLTSDLYLPPILMFPYLEYLNDFINYLNNRNIQGYFFFRKCTLPTIKTLNLLKKGKHIIGLHLENSRSFETFKNEVDIIKSHTKSKVEVFSKHGSGKYKYGLHHYPLYEPEKYLEWGSKLGMKIFLGNLEDPTIPFSYTNNNMLFFPAAFWLEYSWRNIILFDINWLIQESKNRNIVLLIHVENVLYNKLFLNEFETIIRNTKIRII